MDAAVAVAAAAAAAGPTVFDAVFEVGREEYRTNERERRIKKGKGEQHSEGGEGEREKFPQMLSLEGNTIP